jgi:hypothetical protein
MQKIEFYNNLYCLYIKKNTAMFLLCCLDNALNNLQNLGESAVCVLVGDNGVVYIHVAETLTPSALRFICAHGIQMVELSFQQYDRLRGNTPMNLRNAIQSGDIKKGDDSTSDIWIMLCRMAGIEEGRWSTYAKLLAGGTLRIAGNTLHITGSVLQNVGSAMCSASQFMSA